MQTKPACRMTWWPVWQLFRGLQGCRWSPCQRPGALKHLAPLFQSQLVPAQPFGLPPVTSKRPAPTAVLMSWAAAALSLWPTP